MEIKNRIAEALMMRGMKQIDLAEKTGISIHTLNPWYHNKWQPKATPLNKMAKVLDVSELWLAGYDVPMERPIEQKKADELSDMIKILKNKPKLYNVIDYCVKLSDEQILVVEAMLKTITEKSDYNE